MTCQASPGSVPLQSTKTTRMPAWAAIQTRRSRVTVLPEPGMPSTAMARRCSRAGMTDLGDPAALAQPGIEVAAGVGDAQRRGQGGVGGLVVAAGGPGDLADGVDLGDEGLALAVGAPFGPGGQPLAPGHAEGAHHGADGDARGAWQATMVSGQVTSEPMP